MKKLTYSTFSYNDGEAVLAFDRGLNIARVELRFRTESQEGNVCVRYAQNSVLDVLLPLGNRRTNETQVYELQTPICATHLFVNVNPNVTLEEITVFESEKTDGITYPHSFDTDLSALYRLCCVRVRFDAVGEVRYSVFLSADGSHFSLLADQTFGGTEDVIDARGRDARFVRVLVTYCAESVRAPMPDVTFAGEKIGEGAQPNPIEVPDFEDTPYAQPITEEEILSNVYGIVERRLGASYKDWFSFALTEKGARDDFILSDRDGKIRIEGHSGVSLAAGLNHYLKYYCKVHVSQVGNQVRMPDAPIPVGQRVRKETRARVRFAYNVCAHSYTMSFWDEEEWQKELDFLALSGVNLVMDITAVEEVWRRFLSWMGYSCTEVRELISGPAYYAWQWIGNQMGQGAPLPDAWFAHRVELARKNHRLMRSLGMEIVLPGYSGMVPSDLAERDSDVCIVTQGSWCTFKKAAMLHPEHPSFERYAARYYEILQKVYGKNRHFTDSLFHEGGTKKGLSERLAAKRTLDMMKRAHPDAVWVITSWQGNPTSELLAGIGDENRNHALILDLYAEKLPNYGKGGRRKTKLRLYPRI